MGKVRVYELAEELDVDSKALLRELKADGDFVRSASSTLENPVVQRLRQRHGQATPPQPAATAATPHPAPGKPAPGSLAPGKPTPGKPTPSASPAPPPATSTPTTSVRRQDRQQRPSTPGRSQRHGAWTINDLARKLRLDPAVLDGFLTSHGVDTSGTLTEGLVEEVMARLLVNRNTSGPAQLVLMPGEELSKVASRHRTQAAIPSRPERERDQPAARVRGQQPRTVDDPATDRSVMLWQGALRRWHAQGADLSRQVRSPQWSSNPRQLRSLSTHWSQVHLVDHHKALLKGLTDQKVKTFGMHRGTREALADAQLFWMPQASVNRISHTRTIDLAILVPRDVSTGLVAFESLVPAYPAARWLASSVPGVRDHAYRSLLWFIDANTVHVVGWRHAHPLAVTDPDGVDPVLLTYLHDIPSARPVWNDAQLEDVCASWPWVPATHFSYGIEAVVDLASIPNPDQRACLAAVALTWEDIATTRRPPRTRTASTDTQREQSPEEQFEQHRFITPGTRYVQLKRTSLEELHRIGPDRQGQRTYHFSWMVRGHQRRQHYGPGGTLTKVIDIAPHQRGPRGAAMLGPKVYLLPPPLGPSSNAAQDPGQV